MSKEKNEKTELQKNTDNNRLKRFMKYYENFGKMRSKGGKSK